MSVLELRIYWGTILLDIEHLRLRRPFTIGEARKADLFIASDGLPDDAFPLLRTIDGGAVLTFTTAMQGELEMGGVTRRLEDIAGESDPDLDGARRVRLERDVRAVVRFGGVTFALRFVDSARPLPFKPFGDTDFRFVNLAFVSLMAHLALVVTLVTQPYAVNSLREDFVALVPQVVFDMPVPPPRKKPPIKHPEIPSEARHGSMRVTSSQRRITDRISAMLGKTLAGFGAGNISLSKSLADVVGTRAPTGGGLTLRGGPAGFGTSRDIGTPSLIADNDFHEAALHGRKERSMLTLNRPMVTDAMDASIIKRVVADNKAQVRYCYEVELQRDQNLEGRVLMRWMISATGAVVGVEVVESTLQSPRVGACLSDKIRLWRFPQPAGGGTVEVRYPFIFTHT